MGGLGGATVFQLGGRGEPTYIPPRAQLTLMSPKGPPSRIDHPQSSGGLAPPAPSAEVSPPSGQVSNETPLRMMAQIRDGVAMFGSGAVHLVELPLIGANALPAIAQVSASIARAQPSQPNIATRIMLVEHTVTAG